VWQRISAIAVVRYEILTDSRTAWGMLQDSSLHRVVEKVSGRVAGLNNVNMRGWHKMGGEE